MPAHMNFNQVMVEMDGSATFDYDMDELQTLHIQESMD